MFDRWLDGHMAAAGLNDEKVAAAVGADATTVSRWRRGLKLPDRQFLLPLAKLFNTSPTTILYLTEREAFEALVNDPQRQQELLETLAAVPEMNEVAARLARMTPEKRAAWLKVLIDDVG